MSPSPQQLAPAGSSTYSSDTMYVGDGTWDSERNTFLLPNLMGFNFATMRYNGMGNRFRDQAGYISTVRAHGIIAAITFLVIVPSAILIAKFYHRNGRLALRAHICLQLITLFLATAAIILGFISVGMARSLTNPHHGIGLAIYVMIWAQVLGGAFVHHTEKGKERIKIPLKLFFHQWLGRAVALLGFAQVALGLTLYGSPEVLFILYALWGFFLLMLYFFLSFHYRPQTGFYDDGTSYYTGTQTELTEETRRSRHRGGRLGALAAAGAAGAGLAAWRRRSRSRSRSQRRSHSLGELTETTRPHSRRDSRYHDSIVHEKLDNVPPPARHTWRNRLLGATAGVGVLAAAKNLFSRKEKHVDDESDAGTYRPPIAGAPRVSQSDVSRVEGGLAPASPPNDHWRRVAEREAAQAAAGGAVLGAAASAGAAGSRPSVNNINNRPPALPSTILSEESSLDTPTRPSRYASRPDRQNGGVRRRHSGESISSTSSLSPERPPRTPGLVEGVKTLGFGGFLRLKFDQMRPRRRREDAHVEEMREHEMERERIARMNSQRRRYTGDGAPGPRRTGRASSLSTISSDITGSTPAISRHTVPNRNVQPTNIPPLPVAGGVPGNPASVPLPPSTANLQSGSEAVLSAAGRYNRNNLTQDTIPETAVLGAGAGAGALGATSNRRDTSQQRSSADAGSMNSPPVSVKVKMHQGGRHVTLRRLNDEEAAAERERQRQARGGSASDLSNVNEDRWRRTDAAPVPGTATSANAPIALPPPPPGPLPVGPASIPPPGTYDNGALPPPPPIPAAAGSGLGSSPGGSNLSRPSNYDTNRRRRRAERAREQRRGSHVEFT